MKKGIFYMLTATEIQKLKLVISDLRNVSDPDDYSEDDVAEALEILDKLQPLDSESLTELGMNLIIEMDE